MSREEPSQNSPLLTISRATISNAYKVGQEATSDIQQQTARPGREWPGGAGRARPLARCFHPVQCGHVPVRPNGAEGPNISGKLTTHVRTGNPYFSILEMNFSFSELCAGPAQCDCRTNPTYRHQTVQVKVALGPARCPAQCPAPRCCSLVAEQSKSGIHSIRHPPGWTITFNKQATYDCKHVGHLLLISLIQLVRS